MRSQNLEKNLKKRLILWLKPITKRCLRNGQEKDARKHAGKRGKSGGPKVSVMLVIASLFPYSAVVKIRSMIKSKNFIMAN